MNFFRKGLRQESSEGGGAWYEQGQNPDYRFSLANERTFLAWVRTALAILAGALVLHQVAEHFELRSGAQVVAIGLSVLAMFISASSYGRWRGNEIAMRHGRSLPRSMSLVTLGAIMTVLSLAAVVAMLL